MTLISEVSNFVQAVGADVKSLQDSQGDLGALETEKKDSLVKALNWVWAIVDDIRPKPKTIILNDSGTTSWTVPDDWTDNNSVEAWGGGGAGNSESNNTGGGGGAYVRSENLSLTVGTVLDVVIPSEAMSGDGGDTYFGGTDMESCLVGAQGGKTGGPGGRASSSVGSIRYSGGSGGGSGGGGGGSGYPGGAGSPGASTDGGDSGDAKGGSSSHPSGESSPDGGGGGRGGTANYGDFDGHPGGVPGGGGGGLKIKRTPGSGGGGQIRITYVSADED